MVDDSLISVIIQGPVEFDKENQDINFTKLVCESVRKILPRAEIIFSTWEGEDVSSLDVDSVIFNSKITSNRMIRPNETVDVLNTVNHQLITTLSGLKTVGREFALKLRSDTALISNNFLEIYEKYQDIPDNELFLEWKFFDKRVVTLPTFNINRKRGMAYNVCDWAFFGQTKDLLDYFDIPIVDTFSMKCRPGEKYPYVVDNFGAEQYYCLRFINKHKYVYIENAVAKNEKIKKEFEIFLANNIIPVSAANFGLYSFKYKNRGYATETWISHGFYTLTEWELLYNRYGGGDIDIPFRINDRIVFKIYLLKDYIIEHSPLLNIMYKKILNLLRKFKVFC